MLDLKKILQVVSPIRIILVYLFVMVIMATISWGGDIVFYELSLVRLILVYLGMIGSFFIMNRLGFRDSSRWEHRVITSMILYLLFDPLQSYWVFLLAGILAETISRTLRSLVGPVFNPAASATLVLSIFGILPGWWGMSFAPRLPLIEGGVSVAAFITTMIAGYVLCKYRKQGILLTLIPSFFVCVWLLIGLNLAIFLTLEGTALFYWLVMVVEPKTSPMIFKEQLIYGAIVGSMGAVMMKFNFLDPYIGSLLIGNLVYFAIGFYYRKIRLLNPITPKVALS